MRIFNAILVHRIFRALWIAFIIATIFALFYYGFSIIYPFLIAWLLAYIMNPLVRFLEKKGRLPRGLAVLIALLFIVIIISLIIFVFATKIISESSHIIELLQEKMAVWMNWLNDYFLSDSFQQLFLEISTVLDSLDVESSLSQITSTIGSAGPTIVAYLFTFLKSFFLFFPKLALNSIIITVAAFFISKQWNTIAAKLKSVIPNRIRSSICTVARDLQHAVFGYLKGHLILSSITAFVFFIGLLIIGAPYAFTIAIIGGIVDLIPVVGIPAIIVPWVVYAFFEGNNLLGTGLLILWPIILVTRHALEPKVYSSSIGLNPLLLLIFLFAGLKLFGVVGIFIGILSLVVLTTLQKVGVFHDLWSYIMTGKIASN
ncbi:sporulation integral membrane protein YtvI [Virgibacillus proomii]|uniref:sporulation integral membrane protein YtvI n=1 Tax=Virgibacillus proomii TaxID=84407 RepID=UPI001C0F5ACF|nr:sporulation integral membrane protein YtvI [Virgibacillus proomii]MBU5267076.1 sporulation integral membrane protein YtvI [Virgibacillus proomii]